MIWFGLILVFLSLALKALALNVLIFGDSIDRQTVIEWCNLQRSLGYTVKDVVWGSNTLKYSNNKGRMATLYCGHGNDSISFIHMFGSPDRGMYLNYFANTYSDKFIDSIDRVPHAFEVYKSSFGSPDIVILQFASWDSQRVQREHPNITPQSSLWLNFTIAFEEDHRNRIDQLISLIGPDKDKTEIVLRTAAITKAGYLLIIEFNRIIRSLAKSYNLRLFDLNQDIWSTADYQYSYEQALFRDFMHPKQFYTAIAGDKYLEKRYSSAWIYRTDDERKHFHRKMLKHLLNPEFRNSSLIYKGYGQPVMMLGIVNPLTDIRHPHLLTLQNFSHVYIYHEKSKSLHLITNHSDNNIIPYLRLGYTDVLPLNTEEFSHVQKKIPISYPIQLYPKRYYLVNVTSIEEMVGDQSFSSVFTMNFLQFRQIQDNFTISFLQLAYDCPVIPTLEPVLLDLIPPPYLLDISKLYGLKGFHIGITFQYIKERTVYRLTETYHKKAVKNMAELSKYVSDVSEIFKLYNDIELEVFPTE